MSDPDAKHSPAPGTPLAADDDRDLATVRADIDAIDARIQELIADRARCAQRVAAIKLEDA